VLKGSGRLTSHDKSAAVVPLVVSLEKHCGSSFRAGCSRLLFCFRNAFRRFVSSGAWRILSTEEERDDGGVSCGGSLLLWPDAEREGGEEGCAAGRPSLSRSRCSHGEETLAIYLTAQNGSH
jgi:hypothetical protein